MIRTRNIRGQYPSLPCSIPWTDSVRCWTKTTYSERNCRGVLGVCTDNQNQQQCPEDNITFRRLLQWHDYAEVIPWDNEIAFVTTTLVIDTSWTVWMSHWRCSPLHWDSIVLRNLGSVVVRRGSESIHNDTIYDYLVRRIYNGYCTVQLDKWAILGQLKSKLGGARSTPIQVKTQV